MSTDTRPGTIAVCACGTPLIGTFVFPQKEFLCLECGNLYAWLMEDRAPFTDELAKRQEELREEWAGLAKNMIFKETRHVGCDKCDKGQDHELHATAAERRASDRAWSEFHKRVGRA